MTIAPASWREQSFRVGCAILIGEAVFYLAAICVVPLIQPLPRMLNVAIWCFVAGSLLSLGALTLVSFGTGWKRIGAMLIALFGFPLWYGFTLY